MDDQVMPLVVGVMTIWAITIYSWIANFFALPNQPWVHTLTALVATAWLAWRVPKYRRQVARLRLGRDGERAVGQYLETLRRDGAVVVHDVPAGGCNIDHVVIARQGIYAVETKTVRKPRPKAKIIYDGEQLTIDGRQPDRDPIAQAMAEADWLKQTLLASTGKDFPVRGVVVFPRWWIEETHRERARKVWVLEPKALPKFIQNAPTVMTAEEVAMASFHLSRYVRGMNYEGV